MVCPLSYEGRARDVVGAAAIHNSIDLPWDFYSIPNSYGFSEDSD